MRRARILTHATALLVGITLMPTAVAAPAAAPPAMTRVVSRSPVRSYPLLPISTVMLT